MNYYSLLNTPVIQYPSGRKIGVLSDIFLKENTTEVLGIVATNRSLVYSNRLYKPFDIIYVGTQEISVVGPGIKFVKVPKAENPISFKELIGLKTLSDKNSENIGTVKDGYFDMEAGSLTELLVGGSIADDIINGRKVLKTEAIREENGIVKAKNPLLIPKSGGLKAIARRSNYDKTN